MTGHKVLIRPGVLEDLPALQQLEAEGFPDPWSPAQLEQAVTMPQGVLRVGCLRNEVIAYAAAWVVGDEGELTRLVVSPANRCQGVGVALLRAMLQDCYTAGARQMFLEVRPGNEAARALYGSYGFTLLRIRRQYYKDGDDALVLRYAYP